MKDAIQKSIEGGWFPVEKGFNSSYGYWSPQDGFWSFEVNDVLEKSLSVSDITSDPLFWQALGKAMGWGNNCPICDSKANGLCSAHKYTSWMREWHRFIDHLAEGKDAESFFNTLLK